ncbi:MAG: hypothetical protein ABSA27_07275 [Terriglobales bacterium]|jgi:hypothetical protein
MKNKALAIQVSLAVTEKRAKWRQVSGQFRSGVGAQVRRLSFLICVLGLPCASWAQTDQASWANLSALRAGQKIQVVEMNSKKHSGSFVNVSDTEISYQDTAGEQTIQKQEVRSVKLMENKHRVRNTLAGMGVGGGVGAGVGAGIEAATFHSCSSQSFCIQPVGKGGSVGIAAAIGFVGGAAVGAVVGALLPSHHTIYRANSH